MKKRKLDVVDDLVFLVLYFSCHQMEDWTWNKNMVFKSIMGKLTTLKRLETVEGRDYLFCVGFEVDGGIFRKLESSCL
jgi:hypothetical protein